MYIHGLTAKTFQTFFPDILRGVIVLIIKEKQNKTTSLKKTKIETLIQKIKTRTKIYGIENQLVKISHPLTELLILL